MRLPGISLLPLFVAMAVLSGGCQSAYYGTMDRLGVHKRDILVDRVEDGKQSQQEAKEEFASALDAFLALSDVDGGQLEAKYRSLNQAYERSEAKAKAVWDRIDSIRHVARALFDEWEDELDEYASEGLRRSSARQLENARSRYGELMAAMEGAAEKMAPVLAAFKDQTLYLKHNLNARAVAGLQEEFVDLQADIALLIEEMEQAIAQADAFIEEMRESGSEG